MGLHLRMNGNKKGKMLMITGTRVVSINFQFTKTALEPVDGWIIAIIAICTNIQVQRTDSTFPCFARIHLQIHAHFIVVQQSRLLGHQFGLP